VRQLLALSRAGRRAKGTLHLREGEVEGPNEVPVDCTRSFIFMTRAGFFDSIEEGHELPLEDYF
jgi:hypothetical protein